MKDAIVERNNEGQKQGLTAGRGPVMITGVAMMAVLAAILVYLHFFRDQIDARDGVLRIVQAADKMEVHFSGSGRYKGAAVVCGEIMPRLELHIPLPPQRFVYLVKRRHTVLLPSTPPGQNDELVYLSELWRVACEDMPQEEMDTLVKRVRAAETELQAVSEQIGEITQRQSAGEINPEQAQARLEVLEKKRSYAEKKYRAVIREITVY